MLAIGFERRPLLQYCGQLQLAMGKCLNREVIAFENNTVRALIAVECHTCAIEYLLGRKCYITLRIFFISAV
jgi:hypothetical protein